MNKTTPNPDDLICIVCKGIFSRDKKHTCTCHKDTHNPDFDLSSKMTDGTEDSYNENEKIFLRISDVKEFIRLLKDKAKLHSYRNNHGKSITLCEMIAIINKLAGDTLK